MSVKITREEFLHGLCFFITIRIKTAGLKISI